MKALAPKDTVFCASTVFCMPTITVNVDDTLKEQMEKHPEINWSEVTRQAIRSKIEKLELMDELTADSELSEADVNEIAAKINESARKRIEEESE
jgi:ribosomal protein L15